MPYVVDFEPIVEEELGKPDVQAALREPSSQIDEQFIRDRLVSRYSEMESELRPSIEEYDRVEMELLTWERDLRAPWYIAALTLLPLILAASFFIVLLAWILGANFADLIVSQLFQGTYFSISQKILAGYFALTIPGVAFAIRWRRRQFDAIENAIRKTVHGDSPGLLEGRIAGVESSLAASLKSLVKQNIFETIGEAGEPFFQDTLFLSSSDANTPMGKRISSASGLSEVPNRTHETPTQARREIMQLLQTLPGASIGLSGPRGAGKSTLLRSLTGANLKLGDKEAIAIYTAAPVEYDGREFLLHLFASLCRQVLRTHGANDALQSGEFGDERSRNRLDAARIQPYTSFLLVFGIVAIVLALSLAFIMARLGAGSSLKPLATALAAPQTTLLLFGLFALILRFTLHIHRALETDTPLSRTIGAFRRITRYGYRVAPRPPESDLIRLTRAHLSNIHFQRSFTSGWSGSIKVPAGFDIASSASTMLAERQESLPELVARFSNYVRDVAAAHDKVIIAIDELDKLKSADDAERFINELKSIFNIHECFYLVSVSEDALNSFERRGLAFRDVFDSAFDDIRYLGHMDLLGSRKILLRRVLNLPDPFLCLCYILSGGLPRDLIRTARDMFEVARAADGPAGLHDIATKLLQEEADSKLRASISATRSIATEPDTSQFILAIDDLQETSVMDAQFNTKVAALASAATPSKAGESSDSINLQRLRAVQLELKAYLEFLHRTGKLLKLLQTQAGWQGATRDGKVEELARIRRSLEFNIGAASTRLAKIT